MASLRWWESWRRESAGSCFRGFFGGFCNGGGGFFVWMRRGRGSEGVEVIFGV